MEDKKLLVTNVLIHGFAVAHAATAAALSQTMVGDEAVLATLTVTMIIAISRQYNQKLEVSQAFGVLGNFAGSYIGTRAAVMLVKWIPVLGNSVNAIATAVTTEILGWAVYLIVRENRSITSVDKSEINDLIARAKKEREKFNKEWNRIDKVLGLMSDDDKKKYDDIMQRFQDKDLSEDEHKELEQSLQELLKKYGLN